VEGRIFKIEVSGSQTRLTVNFERKMVTLFKEVRNLGRLGLKVPYEIKIAVDEAKGKYPFALQDRLQAGKTNVALQKLETCALVGSELRDTIGAVQAVIDHLDKRGYYYSNLHQWVANLDAHAEAILVKCLRSLLR
jgi:hypothetical protein